MAGQDVYENEMRIVNDVDYLRGLLGEDSVAITPTNLLSALFQERGGIGDANNAISTGIYFGVDMDNSPSSDYSSLVVLKITGYIHQFFLTLNSDHIFYRRSLDSGTNWYDWKSISIT